MKGMSLIVKTVGSWVKMLIFVFGVYIVLFGHLTPGGGFAGGVILASSYILLMLAFGRKQAEKNLPLALVSRLDCLGAILFVFIAVIGLSFGGAFFVNFLYRQYWPGRPFDLISAGTIPLSNIAIGLKVGASLFMVVFILSIFRPESSGGQKE
jgi:multisubunit Na+/H+ antiporter MnhB subunit